MIVSQSSCRRLAVVLWCVALAGLAGCDVNQPGNPEGQESRPTGQEDVANDMEQSVDCDDLPSADQLATWLRQVPEESEIGGLFSGRRQWAAVVNRQGQICTVAVGTEDPADAWPGSIAIAKAKAFTANAFSTNTAPLSTARLYTLSQPGHSLFGAANGNPFNPACLATPEDPLRNKGEVCGGTITFGGGVALYRDEVKVGGLGVSGDTACADHEVAKRVRAAANLNPPQGQDVDDIQYGSVDEPSVFIHPLCPNTWRNGEKIGEESPVQDYQQQGQ